MSDYIDHPEEVREDTKKYLESELGQHHITTLIEMQIGFLSTASNMNADHPDRYLAKYNAIQEVLDFINSPLR